jgi:lipoprotein
MLSLPKKYFIVVTAAALLTSGCAAQPGPAPVVNTTKQVVALDNAGSKPAVQRDGTGKPVLPDSAVLPDNAGAAFVQAKTTCTGSESRHSFVLMPKEGSFGKVIVRVETYPNYSSPELKNSKVEFIEEVTPQKYPLVEFSTQGNTPATVFLEDSRGAAASLSRDFDPCSSP